MKTYKNIIFVHIPKTAGSSIRKSLERGFGEQTIFPEHDQGSIVTAMKNDTHQHFLGHVGASFALAYKPKDQFVFSFLRNPLDRLISLYNFFHGLDQKKIKGDFVIDYAINNTAEAFFESKDPRILSYLDNTQTWQLAIATDPMTRKKYSYLNDLDLLNLAQSNIHKMHFCGITEYSAESINTLGQLLGVSLTENRINASVTKMTFDDLSPNIREKLREYTKLDNILYENQKKFFEQWYLS